MPQHAKNGFRLGRLAAATLRSGGKPSVVVYGNCQALAIHQLLASTPEFIRRYRLVRVPGAHEINRAEIPFVRKAISEAKIIVTQLIKDDYRGLPIGTSQIAQAKRSDADVITFPSIFYKGLHPYLVYVHASGPLGTPAPRTEGYHDLRFIHAASMSYGTAEASEWLATFEGDSNAIRESAAQSLRALQEREDRVKIRVSHAIPSKGPTAFWTLNHPSNAILEEASAEVLKSVDIERPRIEIDELLTSVRAPIHPDVMSAMAWDGEAGHAWTIRGKNVDDSTLLAEHLAFYRANPHVLATAVAEHRDLLSAFGFRD